MSSLSDMIIFVYTGNRKYAGTNNSVFMILHSDNGKASKTISLNNSFANDFERDKINTFRLSLEDVGELDRFGAVDRLEVWKESTLGFISSDWFVDKIVVENGASNESFVFPFFRWIKSGYHYNIRHLDTSLPQLDAFPEQRKKEMEEKRKTYQYEQHIPDGPVQVKEAPPSEQFPFDVQWNIPKSALHMKVVAKFSMMFSKKWTKFTDMHSLFEGETYYKPSVIERWNSDEEFGRKRIASINPALITLLENVPDNFPVTDDLLEPVLEGITIQRAIRQKRLFICDLKILEGIPTKPGTSLCTPMALLFVNKDKVLVPVAIQLFQEPGPENPIFTPMDDAMTWTLVKMWYNNADAAYHQALTHVGMTHLLMEGVALAVNRNLSASHPIFKLMAPHFLYIMAINGQGLATLISEGGWVDKTMNFGAKGMKELIKHRFGTWRMDVDGLLPENLKARGLDDPKVLPGFHFRNDALLIYKAIKKYVTSYVRLYYESEEMLKGDEELQGFAEELAKERNKSEGGVGLKGVPGNGTISSFEELINIVVCVIYTCSVAHASANFGQYDEYSFQPSYPLFLKGKPPTSKDVKLTEQEIVETLADQAMCLDILNITTVLSRKGTRSLGDFEVQYVFDPKGRKLADQFRQELKEIGDKIKARNEQLETPYDDLLPDCIPNSISI